VKKISLYIIIVFCSTNLLAQQIEDRDLNTLLRNNFTLGLNLNTRGWGFNADYQKQKTFKYKYSYGVTVGNIRHSKESKIVGTSGSKGYYFGKINSLVAIRFTYGGNLRLFESKRENGIEIFYKWRIGPSLGLLKPVYVQIDKVVNANTIQIPERYNPEIHFNGKISSSSSWIKGIGESKLNYGLFLKTAIDFNFAKERTSITGGELGVMVDYYPFKNIEILYKHNEISLFTALYLQFNLGKKF